MAAPVWSVTAERDIMVAVVFKFIITRMEAEIQLPLSRFQRVSFLILVGWCEEGHPANNNLLQHSHG